MAKNKKATKTKTKVAEVKVADVPTGPYLSAALLAEKVLIEKDNVATLVRIVDKIIITQDWLDDVALNNPGGEMSFPNLTLFVSFKSGGFVGTLPLLIVLINPSGGSEPIGMSVVKFTGSNPVDWHTLLMPVTIKWDKAGVYWYDISLDNKPVTRVPVILDMAKEQKDEDHKVNETAKGEHK